MLRRCLAPLVLAVALQAATASAAVPAWTTYRHDGARSGVDPDSTAPVTPTQAWQTPELDGQVYAQPLVYGSYVYVATENDTIYKLSAATGAVAWSQHLAVPEPASAAPCGDIAPTIGITGTPVLDPATNRIYAVGAVSTPSVHHELFALDAGTGQSIAGFPIGVDPSFPSGGAAVNQLQRPGLALDGGRVLIGFGGNDGDCATYWGWLVSAPTAGGVLSWLQVDASHSEGAIWAAGNAPLVDSAGNVYVATGNGAGNGSSDPDYGDSVVKLNASASPLDWWAPSNWQSLDQADADLGSSMPTLLPGGYLLQSGKDSNGYLLRASALGHVSAPVGEVSGICGSGSFGGSVYDPANSTVYVACGGVKALSVGSGAPPSLSSKPGFSASSSANGPPTIAGGLVWATNYTSGTLYGLDPSTGATRSHFAIPENGPSHVNHFASPSAGGGRLFVASGDQVTAFSIAQAPGATATTTTLASSANPARTGNPVTLTATVSPSPDGGAVTFTDGSAPIPGCSSVAVSPASGGQVICHAAFAHSGSHRLLATYSGDTYYAPSASAPLSESVAGRPAVDPVLTGVSLTPRRFTAKHRATLRLTVSRAATVTVAFTQLRRGHLVGGRCAVKARHGKRCRTRVTLRRVRFRVRAGHHAFKLSPWRLAPGRYTLLIYATDRAGRRSRTIRIAVTILAPRAALDGLFPALDSLSL